MTSSDQGTSCDTASIDPTSSVPPRQRRGGKRKRSRSPIAFDSRGCGSRDEDTSSSSSNSSSKKAAHKRSSRGSGRGVSSGSGSEGGASDREADQGEGTAGGGSTADVHGPRQGVEASAGSKHSKQRKKSSSKQQGETSTKVKSRRTRKRKRKVPRERGTGQRYSSKLLRYAESGEYRKAKRALRKGADPNTTDEVTRDSALHKAARRGDYKMASLLLRKGAIASMGNHLLRTPAHEAAAFGQLLVLALLLAAPGAPDLDAEDLEGWTAYDLAARAVERAELAAQRQQELDEASRPAADDMGAEWEDHAANADADWAARLAQEWSGGEDPFGDGDWDGDAARDAPCGEQWDSKEEGDWADTVGQQFEAKRRAAARAAHAHAATSRQEAARKRAQAASAAFKESERILQEEREKDRLWREAVAKGNAAGQRAAYQTRWVALLALPVGRQLSMSDVPWIVASPVKGEGTQSGQGGAQDLEALRRLVMHGVDGQDRAAVRKRLREELLRWHPDKFIARFGSRLPPASHPERDAVLQRVTATSQALNALSAQLFGSG